MKDASIKPLLSVENLSVKFGSHSEYFDAVKGLNIQVYPGEIIGLIGESGSGKTTSAQSILGLTQGWPGIVSGKATWKHNHSMLPDCETYISMDQGRVSKKKTFPGAHRRCLKNILGSEIASIFQEPKSALNPYISVGNHLLECLKLNYKSADDLVDKGQKLLTKVGIVDADQVWNLFPHHLSGGMAQRVMIAMAISSKPDLIIADEPTTALDVTTQAKLLQLFQSLREESGISFIIISHDIGVIREITSRVYVMYQGSIVEQGNTHDVIFDPKDDYTKHLLKSFYKLSDNMSGTGV